MEWAAMTRTNPKHIGAFTGWEYFHIRVGILKNVHPKLILSSLLRLETNFQSVPIPDFEIWYEHSVSATSPRF